MSLGWRVLCRASPQPVFIGVPCRIRSSVVPQQSLLHGCLMSSSHYLVTSNRAIDSTLPGGRHCPACPSLRNDIGTSVRGGVPPEATRSFESTADAMNSAPSPPTGTTGAAQTMPRPVQPSPMPPSQDPYDSQHSSWPYLVALCALSVVICYADRSNISTAMIPMSQQFGWDKGFQGIVLSSFFAGYATTQVLGGALADRYGGKLVLASGVLLWSFFTLVTPDAAAAGTVPLLTARVALGIGEGVAFPSIHSLISANVPRARQTTAVGIVTAASYVGTALAFGLSPLIIARTGWQGVYHLFAALAVLWLPPWLLVSTQRPHPVRAMPDSSGDDATAARHTSLAQNSSVPAVLLSGDHGAPASSSLASPWEEQQAAWQRQQSNGHVASNSGTNSYGFWPLLKRKEVWAICAAQYGQSWGMYGLLTWLPTFFHDAYNVEVTRLGSYTLVPYVVQGLVGLTSGILADRLMEAGHGVRAVRVGLQTVGMLGPAACLVLAVTVAGGSAGVASAVITVGLGLSALTLGGVSASHLDIAPRHAGAIYGAGNTAATVAGLLSVPTTGFVLQATGSWTLVFAITAMHYCAGAAAWAAWAGESPLPEDGGGGTDGSDSGTDETKGGTSGKLLMAGSRKVDPVQSQ